MSTYQILEQAVDSWPQYPAIIDSQGSMSYSELYKQTEALRKKLMQAGLKPCMGLGVMGRNGRFFVAAMLAGMACGATVLPLSPQLKKAEMSQILQDTGLHAVLDDGSGLLVIQGRPLAIPFADQMTRFTWTGAVLDKAMTGLSDAAFIRYTSGTTGRSKGVVLSHRRILERVAVTQKALSLEPGDAVLWVLPMAFHFLVSILVYIRSGAAIIVCKDLLAQTLIDAANQYKATLLYASPMHFRLLAADLSGKRMPTLRYAISTSSAIPAAIAKSFRKRFDKPLAQAYGIIEAGLPLLDNLSDAACLETVGFPVDGFEVALLDDDFSTPVGTDQVGHLAVEGPGMFDAYLKPWQSAGHVMKKGWFMTGDLARYDATGRIIVCGRKKNLINVSGNKVFPEEVEAVLNSHADIADCRVFGGNHPLMGEIVCAEVVMAEGVILDSEKILRFCRDRLSTYKVPQRLQQVNRIEYTRSGKIKRMLEARG